MLSTKTLKKQTQFFTDADEDKQRQQQTDQTRHTLRQRLFQYVGAPVRLRRQVLESQYPTRQQHKHRLSTIAHSVPSTDLVQWWISTPTWRRCIWVEEVRAGGTWRRGKIGREKTRKKVVSGVSRERECVCASVHVVFVCVHVLSV